MPRRDHRKLKTQKLSSEYLENTLKSEKTTLSILDIVSNAIPDMVDSIMAKIDAPNDIDDVSLGSHPRGCEQSKLEKEVSSIKSDVESIKFDVVEILRQLPPRERRKPDSLGDVLNNIFSGKMDVSDENITFGNTPYTRKPGGSSAYRSVPNTTWNTTISKIEEASSDSDTDDFSYTDSE